MEKKLSENLKDMTIKEKIDYIWEYYRLQIIGALCVIFFVGSIINSTFINPPKKQYVNLTIYGPYIDANIMDTLGEEISAHIVDDPDTQAVYAMNIYNNPDDIEAAMAMTQKFYAMISANELDVIIGTYDDLYWLAYSGTLLDLSDILADRITDVPDQDILTITEITGLEDSEYQPTMDGLPNTPYAFQLHGSEIMDMYNLNTEGYYLGIIVNSLKLDESIELIECIY